MRMSCLQMTVLCLAALGLGSSDAAGQQDAEAAQAIRQEIDQLRKEFEARLNALEARLGEVEVLHAPAQAAPQPAAEFRRERPAARRVRCPCTGTSVPHPRSSTRTSRSSAISWVPWGRTRSRRRQCCRYPNRGVVAGDRRSLRPG